MKRAFAIVLGLMVTLSLASAQSPYAGQELRPIKSLSANEIQSLKEGMGMGLARLAELNHYPGPKHVLELAPELELTPSQLSKTEALFAEMRDNAKAIGQKLLEAESALDHDFEQKVIDAESLNSALIEIGNLQARLRFVHLEAHLRQTLLLTEAQVLEYDNLRGYNQTNVEHKRHH